MNGPVHKAIGAVTCIAALAAIDKQPDKQCVAHNPAIVAVLGAGGTLHQAISQ